MRVSKRTVYLVGAGPGDPGLITRAGLEALRQCDVIVYDRLAGLSLLLEARPDAELLFAGKSPARHIRRAASARRPCMSQDEINETLVRYASAGCSVCRLKGGDPFLFGRGGEEAVYLRREGIPFVVIPGVTSAIAAPAYAGIPVTDRRAASSVTFVTGHEEAGKDSHPVNWPGLAQATDSLVVLMGVKHLAGICAQLIGGGKSAATAAAVIQWGTTGRQRVVRAALSQIAQEVAAVGVTNPAILVVGDVVSLGDSIRWFEPGPLAGMRVLVTRPRQQARALVEMLGERGAEPVAASAVRVEPVTVEPEQLRARLAQSWDWVLFTSANGVTSFRDQLLEVGRDWRVLAGARLGAIGPATAVALKEAGLTADFVPSRAIAESLAEELPEVSTGTRVLIPRAQEARAVLPEALRGRGGTVEVLPVYRTVPDEAGLALLRAVLEDEPAALPRRLHRARPTRAPVDIVTFTSSSAVRSLVGAVGAARLAGSAIACIGPITAVTARELGLRVDLVAEEHTIPGLVAALEAYVSAGKD